MVQVEGLSKSFDETVALAGIDFEVSAGQIVGLLGPNGSGKTTVINVLSTLLDPDSGRAHVAGHDVLSDPAAVRSKIALTGQYAAVDGELTGRENLCLFGELLGLDRGAARRRADELLGRFGITAAGRRRAATYSGGMRRRLDLAISLVVEPTVLFLDEPTTGLDPRSRIGLWGIVQELRDRGITIVLTTQYLEEADRLADEMVVIDQGKVIATGTAEQLKARVGSTFCEIVPSDPDRIPDAAEALDGLAGAGSLGSEDDRLTLPAPDGAVTLTEALRQLDAAGIALADISLRRPTLDDVFLALTGAGVGSVAEEEQSGSDR